jgi:hypothetical protein
MTKIFSSIRFGLAAAVLTALPAVAGAVRPKVPVHTPTQAERDAALLRKFDTNHDGVIGPAERRRAMTAHERSLLEKFDANDNGRFGPAEAAAVRAQRIGNIVDRFDRNDDGRLSYYEVRSAKGMDTTLMYRFRVIDTNHDRLLSKREIVASPYVKTPVVHIRPYWNYWTSA